MYDQVCCISLQVYQKFVSDERPKQAIILYFANWQEYSGFIPNTIVLITETICKDPLLSDRDAGTT